MLGCLRAECCETEDLLLIAGSKKQMRPSFYLPSSRHHESLDAELRRVRDAQGVYTVRIAKGRDLGGGARNPRAPWVATVHFNLRPLRSLLPLHPFHLGASEILQIVFTEIWLRTTLPELGHRPHQLRPARYDLPPVLCPLTCV